MHKASTDGTPKPNSYEQGRYLGRAGEHFPPPDLWDFKIFHGNISEFDYIMVLLPPSDFQRIFLKN